MSIVIQCPMCQDLDPEAACRFCSLIPQIHVDEWKLAVSVAKDAPNTGMVPVKSSTLLVINAALANAIAAQQPAGDVVRDAGEVSKALRTIGNWDHRGDVVSERWDEIHGAGSYAALILAADTQPAAGADVKPMVPLSMLRPIAVEAIRAITGCPDISKGDKHLTDEIESVALAAIAASGRQE